VERSKWLLPEIDERSESGDEELLTVSHLTGVTKRSDKNVNMFMAESLEGYKKCKKDDLVINTLWAWMGAMGISPVDGVISPAYNVYRPTEKLLPEYVDMLVRMPKFVSEITRYSKGVWSSRLRLYPEGLYEVYLPVPPVEEQRAIVADINKQLSHFKELNAVTEKTITLLQERRTALISAAVAGKLEEAYA
jgi:type I restriction enzyme S subunit